MIYFVLSHNFVSNGLNFMKLILKNHHSAIMHAKFHEYAIPCREAIAL